jgi:uncharacterized protein (UPF0210 family)
MRGSASNRAFKITRMGELIGRRASERLGVPFGNVDLSLAPTPAQGDSVAQILEAMGLERVLSGAFIPVSQDIGMIEAAAAGTLTLDMIAVPGDTPAATLAAIIADEAAIGIINRKTTAVRIIPAPGKTGGLRGVRGAAGPGHGRSPAVERDLRPAGRPDPGADPVIEQLTHHRKIKHLPGQWCMLRPGS